MASRVVEINPNTLYRRSDLLELGMTDHYIQLLRSRGLRAPGDFYLGAAILRAAGVLHGVEDPGLPGEGLPRGVPVRGDKGNDRRRAEVLPLGQERRDVAAELERTRREISEAFSGKRSG